MIIPDLGAIIGTAAVSKSRSLRQLASAAVRTVPGCVAASAVGWQQSRPVLMSSTHPDTARLLDIQLDDRQGPVWDFLASGDVVICADTMRETRWPGYCVAALRAGARCFITLGYQDPPRAVTLTLFGARPNILDPEQARSAEMLVGLGGGLLGAVSAYDDARRTAAQLRDAAASRTVVDQAKGILMHAFGWDAEEAMERLRKASQVRNVRTTDVAREIIEAGHNLGSWRS